eukprot:SAG11_NODE_9326_length_921_cov_2.947689_1_plen_36_part_10
MTVPESTMAGLAARGCKNPTEGRTTRTMEHAERGFL